MVVATWNLENLFRPGSDEAPGEQGYEAKLTELARVIGGIEPDVIAVQEVGDPEALDDLRERLDGDWQAETSEFPDGRGIRVGFLSRLELAEVEQVREFPEQLEPVQVDDGGATVVQMGRGALRARVSAQGRVAAGVVATIIPGETRRLYLPFAAARRDLEAILGAPETGLPDRRGAPEAEAWAPG